MVEYKIIFSKYADKDKKLLKQAGLEYKAKELLDNGLSIRETARQVGMSTSTVHRIKRKQTRKDILN